MLRGGVGADDLGGDAGVDTVSYYSSSVGVVVDLATGKGSGGEAQGDLLYNVENLSGSQGNDSLYGNAGANVLQGWGGADVLRGGAGADRLDGGAGIDTASYYNGTTGVVVSLASGSRQRRRGAGRHPGRHREHFRQPGQRQPLRQRRRQCAAGVERQ